MSHVRQVRGYIFQQHNGNYYQEKHKGLTTRKEEAYVYSKEDIKLMLMICRGFGNKMCGKWFIVYHPVEKYLVKWNKHASIVPPLTHPSVITCYG